MSLPRALRRERDKVLEGLRRADSAEETERWLGYARHLAPRLPADEQPKFYTALNSAGTREQKRGGLARAAANAAKKVTKGVMVGKGLAHVFMVATTMFIGQAEGKDLQWRDIVESPDVAADIVSHGITDNVMILDDRLRTLSDELETRSPSYKLMMDDMRQNQDEHVVIVDAPGMHSETDGAVGQFVPGVSIHVIRVDMQWHLDKAKENGLTAEETLDYLQVTLAHEVGHRAGHKIVPELADPNNPATCRHPETEDDSYIRTCMGVLMKTITAEADLPFDGRYGIEMAPYKHATQTAELKEVHAKKRSRALAALDQDVPQETQEQGRGRPLRRAH